MRHDTSLNEDVARGAVHRDNGVLTFSLLLNEPDEFEGGGTFFEERGRIYRPQRGVGVVHSALVRHAGFPITSGKRCSTSSPHHHHIHAHTPLGERPKAAVWVHMFSLN